MTNSWFDSRPWMTTLGDVAQEPYVLPDSTPLADLATTVDAHGDAEGINYYGFSLTWAEFDQWSTAFAAFLTAHGIGPGDRVGIYDQKLPPSWSRPTGSGRPAARWFLSTRCIAGN